MALRILHVAPYGPEAWAYGGIPRVVGAMADGLHARGHEVAVCTTDALDERTRLPRPRMATGPQRHVFRNVSNRAAYHLQAFAPVGLSRFLRDRAASFDVAHIHACHHVLGIMASRALTRAGVPYVLSPNGTAPIIERRRSAKRLLGQFGGVEVMARAACVVAVSEAEARQLRQLGVGTDRIARVPNPVDLREFETPPGADEFRRAHTLGNRPVILFLGKVTPRKGVGTLVEAFARLASPRAQLVLAGNDMGGLAEAQSLARTLGLGDRVTLTGLLRGRDRLGALAAADVVVYPSSDEVFGLVVCEALLAGTPVIAGNDSGAAEVLAATGGGLTVPPRDAAALTVAVATVLDAGAAWQREARAAAERVRTFFGIDTVVSALDAVYAGVLAERREASA